MVNWKEFLKPVKGRVIFLKGYKILFSLWLFFITSIYFFIGISPLRGPKPSSLIRAAFLLLGIEALISLYGLLKEKEWLFIAMVIHLVFLGIFMWFTGALPLLAWLPFMMIVILWMLWTKRKR